MAAIFENFFQKLGLVYFLETLGVENFDEIALSLTVKEIAYTVFCVFAFLAKIPKFKMAAIWPIF